MRIGSYSCVGMTDEVKTWNMISLKITKDYILNENRTIELALKEILTVSIPVVYNEII